MTSATLGATDQSTAELLTDLSDLFENSTVGLQILDSDGNIIRANRVAMRLADASEDAYIGSNYSAHVGGAELNGLLAALHAKGYVQAYPVGLSAATGPGALVDAVVTLAGRIAVVARPALQSHRPGDETGSDTEAWELAWGPLTRAELAERTATRDAEEQIAELRDFFDNGPVAIHQVSPEGAMVRANRRQLDLLGAAVSPGYFLGRGAVEFYPDKDDLDTLIVAFMSGGTIANFPTVVLRMDGSHLPVVVYSSPIAEPTGVATRCFLFVDGPER